MRLGIAFIVATIFVGTAFAEDPPQSPPKQTIPGTGGYVWGSGPPAAPNNMPPNQGGSVGVQYPPDRPTTVRCSRNGVQVPC
jgi:hypothetical protein